MPETEQAYGVVEHFSDRDERADIWRAFELFLPTDRYLNLGYSPGIRSHLVGSPQRRLVDLVGDELVSLGYHPDHGPVLDVGSGRGGAATRLGSDRGMPVVGIDLVPFNVNIAHRGRRVHETAFVIGDATRLPFATNVFPVAISMDAIVYMPDTHHVFQELRRVLEPGGVCVLTDLLVSNEGTTNTSLKRFCEEWEMPPLETTDQYHRSLTTTGFEVVTTADLTDASVGAFRRWTSLFLGVLDSPAGGLLRMAMQRKGIDPDRTRSQVKAAHDILPDLRHVLIAARSTESEAG